MAQRDALAKAEGTSRQERKRAQKDALAEAEGTTRQGRNRAQLDAFAEAEGTTRQKRAQKRQKEMEERRNRVMAVKANSSGIKEKLHATWGIFAAFQMTYHQAEAQFRCGAGLYAVPADGVEEVSVSVPDEP